MLTEKRAITKRNGLLPNKEIAKNEEEEYLSHHIGIGIVEGTYPRGG